MDKWLGTRPWGMVVFFFLGVAAGMLNVYRAVAGMGGAVGFRPPPPSNVPQGAMRPLRRAQAGTRTKKTKAEAEKQAWR